MRNTRIVVGPHVEEIVPVLSKTIMLSNGTGSDYYYYGDYYFYTDQDNNETYPTLTQITKILELYYVPFIIAIGIIANGLSFVVFVFTHLNRLSLSVYLAALAVADIGFLCSLGLGWLDTVGFSLVHKNGWCQMMVFTSYVCSFQCVWLVVSFTIERYIAICYPLKRPEMCTVWRAKVVVASLLTVSLPGYAVTLRITAVKQMGRCSRAVRRSVDWPATPSP